jgi:polysaccharide biosynthesis/export protein
MHTIKKINIYVWLFLLLLVSWTVCAEDGIVMPGFGNQPININEDFSLKALAQKILGDVPYKLTPGDTYKIVIQIDETYTQNLILDENYTLEIPFLGTMQVEGMYFSELRHEIIRRIKADRVVDFVDFFLTAPALFEVFIYGGVKAPGFVTVTPVVTLWEAVVLARGFKEGGSYRQIKLTRNEKEYTYDLGKYIREGDLEQNPRLEPGDRIYVPHTLIVAQLKGQVPFPDYFELLPGESLFDLIQMAGGYMPDADRNRIHVSRIVDDGSLRILSVSENKAPEFMLQNGDIVSVKSVLENPEMILIEAALNGEPAKGTEPQKIQEKLLVFNIPYVKGITLLDVLDTFGGPSVIANTKESFIIRETTGETIDVDVDALWNRRDPELDVELKPRDHIVIPVKQATIIVAGEVNIPGTFPYMSNRSVSDYIKAAGGIDTQKGDPRGIYFVNDAGERTKVKLDTKVPPGSLIYVDRNPLEKTTYVAGKVTIIVALVASVISISLNITEIMNNLQ